MHSTSIPRSALWLLICLFVFCVGCSNGGRDEVPRVDDDTSDAGDDNAGMDDDATDDDASMDDDAGDDDAGDYYDIILDDGSAELGMEPGDHPSSLVQGLPVPDFTCTLVNVSYYLFSGIGITNEISLVVYYSDAEKGMPSDEIYRSDPQSVGTPDAWNTIDLTDVPSLAVPIAGPEFWVGFATTGPSDAGPYVGFDEDALLNSSTWVNNNGTWWNINCGGYSGVLMWHARVYCLSK